MLLLCCSNRLNKVGDKSKVTVVCTWESLACQKSSVIETASQGTVLTLGKLLAFQCGRTASIWRAQIGTCLSLEYCIRLLPHWSLRLGQCCPLSEQGDGFRSLRTRGLTTGGSPSSHFSRAACSLGMRSARYLSLCLCTALFCTLPSWSFCFLSHSRSASASEASFRARRFSSAGAVL